MSVDRRTQAVRLLMTDHYCRRAIPRAKHRAKQKSVPFALTADDFKTLMVDQDFRCAVSGIAFPIDRVTDKYLQAFRPSIDRIEPRLGYVPSNVRLVCEIVNTAMNQWGEQALLTLVKEMANRVANRPGEPKAKVCKRLKTKDNLPRWRSLADWPRLAKSTTYQTG